MNFLHCCRTQEVQLHRGETSLQRWIKQVQTLEGVLTLPYFSPHSIFTTSSEQNKRITEKGQLSSGYLLLPLPSVPGQSGAAWHQDLLSADTQISASFLIWSWWRGNLNFQLLLVTLVLLHPEHSTRPHSVWETWDIYWGWTTSESKLLIIEEKKGFLKIFSPPGVISSLRQRSKFPVSHWDIPSTGTLDNRDSQRACHAPRNPWTWV